MIVKLADIQIRIDDDKAELFRQRRWHVKYGTSGKPYIFAYVKKDKNSRYKPLSILKILHPDIPFTAGIGYLNGDTFDLRRENLHAGNRSYFSHKVFTPNPENKSSRFRGVGKGYRAIIKHNRKVIHLGTFDTPEEAAKAYNHAAVKFYGQKAILNSLP